MERSLSNRFNQESNTTLAQRLDRGDALLGRLIAAPLVDDADALGRLAAWRHALGHVAASSLADPAATIAQTPALERAMAQAAAAAKR